MGAIILGPVLLGLNWVAQITLRHMQPSTSRILLGTVVALVLGLLLFALKVSAPIIYGIVEGAFAIGSCAFSLSNLTDDRLTGAAFIGLASSIYLMIRAMDNIRKGREESKVRKNKREAAFEEANRRQTELVEKVNELEGPGSIQE